MKRTILKQATISLFQPAVALMERLKYPQKFILISFVFILPLGLAMYLLFSEIQSQINFAKNEILGNSYLRPLHQLSEDIPELQLLSQSASNQIKPVDMREVQSKVVASFQSLEEIDRQLGTTLRTTDKFQSLKKNWRILQSNQDTESFESKNTQYISILNELKELRSWAGDRSNLILDPDLDTYYLMDVTLLTLPAIQEILAETKLLIQRVILSKQATPIEQAQQIVLLGDLKHYKNKLSEALEVAFSNNRAGNLRPKLTPGFNRFIKDLERLTDLVESLVNTDNISQLNTYFLDVDQSLKQNYLLWGKTINELDILLQNRIDGFSRKRIFLSIFIALVLATAAYFFIGFYLGVMKTVSDLSTASQRMIKETLTDEIILEGRDELAEVVKSFNNIAKALVQANQEVTLLNQRLKLENIRMGAELEVTRKLQQMILPREQELSQIPGLEIAGFMEPAHEVGGDYYDVLYHAGKVKIGIGDVTGHGLESGVLMLMVQTAVQTLLVSQVTDPVQFLSILNQVIYNNVQRMNSDKNLTLALLDYQEGILRLSGQHEEIIVVRGGKVERIDTIDLGFPVGLEEDITTFVGETQIQLKSGDIVALYTDGITEAEDVNGRYYGVEKLCEVISSNWQKSPLEIKQAVIEDVRQHIGEQTVYDDITFLVFKQK